MAEWAFGPTFQPILTNRLIFFDFNAVFDTGASTSLDFVTHQGQRLTRTLELDVGVVRRQPTNIRRDIGLAVEATIRVRSTI